MHLRDLTRFLSELSENNNRPWFVMNKPRYDILREEFLVMVTDLIAELARFDPQVAFCEPKKALFRIHRDLRFARDKRPYKTRFSAGITPRDLRRPSAAGGSTYYFHIDGNGTLLIGAGEYLPPPARLKAIRAHVLNDAPGFAKVINNTALRAAFGELQCENALQRAPKGFDPQHKHAAYFKMKSFFVATELQLSLNAPELLVAQLARGFKDASVLVAWLRSVPECAEAPAAAVHLA